MPCLPSTSISRTLRPAVARARASAADAVVLPVPPLPVTTCSRTPSQSVSLVVIPMKPPSFSPIGGYLRADTLWFAVIGAFRILQDGALPVSHYAGIKEER